MLAWAQLVEAGARLIGELMGFRSNSISWSHIGSQLAVAAIGVTQGWLESVQENVLGLLVVGTRRSSWI
jgi:hypothetical protein